MAFPVSMLCNMDKVFPRRWTVRGLCRGYRRGIARSAARTYIVASLGLAAFCAHGASLPGWLSWRGPEQSGVSRETGLPDKVSADDPLWVVDFPGQSAP